MESSDGIRNQSAEPDPLWDFAEEVVDPPAEPQNSAHSSAIAVTPDPDLVAALGNRVGETERAAQQLQQTIDALHARVETLVSSVADLNKRLDRQRNMMLVQAITRSPSPEWRRVLAVGAASVAAIAFVLLAFVQMRAGPSPAPAPIVHANESPQVTAVEAASAPATPTFEEIVPAPVDRTKPQQLVRANVVVPPVKRIEYVGTLSVDSEPAGTVLVNRRNAGRTPLKLENLRAGSHLIWIEREGYQRWTRVVEVPANRISRVSASLEPVR